MVQKVNACPFAKATYVRFFVHRNGLSYTNLSLAYRSTLFSQPSETISPYTGFIPRLDSGKLETPFPFPPPFFPSLYLHSGFGGGHGFGSASIPSVHRPFIDLGSGLDSIHANPCSDSRCQQCGPKVDSTEKDDLAKEDEKHSDELTN